MRVLIKELTNGLLVEFGNSFAIIREETGRIVTIGDKLPENVLQYVKVNLKPDLVYL